MCANKVAVIGFRVHDTILSRGSTEILEYMSRKTNLYGRITFALSDYLSIYSKTFDEVSYRFTHRGFKRLPNGTLSGLEGMLDRSEIDMAVQPFAMDEIIEDYSYPYDLNAATFMIRKAKYEPHIFSLLQIFPLSVWLPIISVLVAMSLVYFVSMRRRYSFGEIILHSFAVLLRQNSILRPSSTNESLLVFSWVLGAMFLCLAYDSVSLSFLSFPPTNQIKDVPQLAKAVKSGHFHCIVHPLSITELLLNYTKEKSLKIIAQDVKTNGLKTKFESIYEDFMRERGREDIAVIIDTPSANLLTVGNKFVSEDRFFQTMGAMLVSKDFCCKRLVDNFVHRLMASGLYSKYSNDMSFYYRMPRLMAYKEKDTSKRKLTLTDLAPAFLSLILGHVISFAVLIVEIVSNRIRNRTCKEKLTI